jgi:uncharacterized repeat protein (TIGR02543 family)
MNYYCIEPEVAGGWGKNTVFTRIPGKPTIIHKLHYQFDGWLGDELLTSTPCFIVTERLAQEIERARLTGIRFDTVEVTISEQFKELYPDCKLPKFLWLKVEGKVDHDDFSITPDLQLVVSERALDLLKNNGIAHAASVTRFQN